MRLFLFMLLILLASPSFAFEEQPGNAVFTNEEEIPAPQSIIFNENTMRYNEDGTVAHIYTYGNRTNIYNSNGTSQTLINRDRVTVYRSDGSFSETFSRGNSSLTYENNGTIEESTTIGNNPYKEY